MKDLFPGYYYLLSDEDFQILWQKCIFIFDTNILLNFYEYYKETREDVFELLDSIENRLWIPHQVALEYHKNRIKRIKQAESNFVNVKKKLEEATKALGFNNISSKCFPSEIAEEMRESVQKAFSVFEDKLVPYQKDLIKVDGTDDIRSKITNLFQGKIGEPFTSQVELDKIYLEGEQRYKIGCPPGFTDDDKEDYYVNGLFFKGIYGDLIIWKQILKQVTSESLSHVIFITDDSKPDWWRQDNGKPVANRELVEEILQAGASMFYMYNSKGFLKNARKYLKSQIKEESIQQVEEISVSNTLSESEIQNDISPPFVAVLLSKLINQIRADQDRRKKLKIELAEMKDILEIFEES
jgi:hypothetical protein